MFKFQGLESVGKDKISTLSEKSESINYSQLVSQGMSPNNVITEISIRFESEYDSQKDGFPYMKTWNEVSRKWNTQVSLPNPEGLKFTAVTYGIGYKNTEYVMLIGQNEKVYIIYNAQDKHGWRWFGECNSTLVKNEQPWHSFKWIDSAVGNSNNFQTVLLGTNGLPYLVWQDHSNGLWYWGSLPAWGKTYESFSLAKGNNGNIQASMLATDGTPYLIWQDQSDGTWRPCNLPSNPNVKYDYIVSFKGNNGNIQAVCKDADNTLSLIWQNQKSGDWSYYGPLPFEQSEFQGEIAFYTSNVEDEDLSDVSWSVIVAKQVSTRTFSLYKIYLSSAGIWSWGGFYKQVNF